MFFKSYISTYIEKDVKKIISASKETTFMNFMKYVALRTACQLDYNEISRSVGYENISYFHRLFRTKYHMGPKEYRDARKDTFLDK